MKVFKLTEEQYRDLRKAKREMEALRDVLALTLEATAKRMAECNQAFWENVEQLAGVKNTDGKNLRINWVSGTITCDDADSSYPEEVDV